MTTTVILKVCNFYYMRDGHWTLRCNSGNLRSSATKSMWVASLKLRLKEKDMGKWLDDVVISAVQKLLHKQYPLIDGFQLTTSIAAGKADILRGGALQILHVRSNHWVCLAVEQDKSGVKLFDCLYSDIPLSTIDTIISLLHPQRDRIEIKSMKMQEQAGFSDCGVLAIAVATSLCLEKTVARWEQAKMHAHLIMCLEAEKMTPFPKDSNKFGVQGGTKSCHCADGTYCICQRRHKKRGKVDSARKF